MNRPCNQKVVIEFFLVNWFLPDSLGFALPSNSISHDYVIPDSQPCAYANLLGMYHNAIFHHIYDKSVSQIKV